MVPSGALSTYAKLRNKLGQFADQTTTEPKPAGIIAWWLYRIYAKIKPYFISISSKKAPSTHNYS
jgi:hypothetical protein